MGNMPPLVVDVAVLAVALGAYATIWFVSRDLSRIAQIMARVLPLVFFAPMYIVLQPHLAGFKTPPRPAMPSQEMERTARPEPPAPSQQAPMQEPPRPAA